MSVRLIGRSKSSFVINHDENVKRRSEERNGKGDLVKLKNKSINMAGLNSDNKDSILTRKYLARKKAMKMISDAWAGDTKIDMDVDNLRSRVQEKSADITMCNERIKECNERKAELREYYGIENGDITQDDLELLSRKKSALSGEDVSFTQEEEKRLAELESPEFAKYQEQAAGYDLSISKYQKDADDAWRSVEIYNSEIRGIRLERLKFHEMTDAQQKAEKINADASKDAIGMLIGESQEHIQETLEEKREEAKEKAEEKEEKEEKLEEQREEKEEFQRQLEIKSEEKSHEAEKTRIEQEKNAREQKDIIEGAEENSGDSGSLSSQVKAEIKDMLQKMKLLEEDLKGAEVDDTV